MKDFGIEKGSIKFVETSSIAGRGLFFFRKMLWDYLNKMNIGFYDPCCIAAAKKIGLFYDIEGGNLQYIDPSTGIVHTIVLNSLPNYREITALTTITATDGTINATSGTFTQHLPASTLGTKGKVYYIKNTGTGVIIVDVTGGQLIDGLTTKDINPTESIPFQSTGTGYIIL